MKEYNPAHLHAYSYAYAYLLLAIDHALTDKLIPAESREEIERIVRTSFSNAGLTYKEVMDQYNEINDKRWKRIK